MFCNLASNNKNRIMLKTYIIQYDGIWLHIEGIYRDGCDGDRDTPASPPEFEIHEVYTKEDISGLLDLQTIRNIEETILNK